MSSMSDLETRSSGIDVKAAHRRCKPVNSHSAHMQKRRMGTWGNAISCRSTGVYHARFTDENISMGNEDLLAVLLGIAFGAIVFYLIGYHTGRLHGYNNGLERGTSLSSPVQHLKGMSDGYLMALQHTPAQRNEYMNNVLLRSGAMTAAEIEADRRRRFHMQLE